MNFCFAKLNARITAREIFHKGDRFFDAHDIKWEHAIGVCTEGAPALPSCHSGYEALVKQKSPDIIGTCCTIHRHALIVKTIADELKSVLCEVIRAVNLIKGSALNSCLFTELCKGSDSECEALLLHSHIRWLSKGDVFKAGFYVTQ